MKKFSPLVVKKVGLVLKHRQPKAAALALEIAEFLLASKRAVFFAEESELVAKDILRAQKTIPQVARVTKKIVQKNVEKKGIQKKTFSPSRNSGIHVVPKNELPNQCDLILVLGGDGTFLSIARLMQDRSIPIMGINMGQLGFLTEIKRSEAIHTLGDILDGIPPMVSERSLLDVTLERKNLVVFQGLVVNDVVVSKGAIARIIGVQVWVNDKWVHHVRADGVIVSTTTGSTAYALAAGGPLVEPTVPAFVVAPICPHSLTLRPMVISDTSTVRLCLDDRPGPVFLTLDGQDAVEMQEGDIVIIRKFQKHALKLICSPSRSYFSLLREKLKFGARD